MLADSMAMFLRTALDPSPPLLGVIDSYSQPLKEPIARGYPGTCLRVTDTIISRYRATSIFPFTGRIRQAYYKIIASRFPPFGSLSA